MNEIIAVEMDVKKARRTPLPEELRPEQKAIFPAITAEVFAMKAFKKLDERLKGKDKELVNALMSLMMYVAHVHEHKGLTNWWDNQMAAEAILEIVSELEWEVE
jgi:ferritin-like protein